jgi:hypothetical protein
MTTLPIFHDHNPSNPWTVTNEQHTVDSNGQIRLTYAPKKGTVVISGFTETQSTSPGLTEFYIDYQDATDYRTAQQIVQFSLSQAATVISVSYSGVSQTVTAEHMNTIKDHVEDTTVHLSNEQATKLTNIADDATKVEVSTTNGNVKIDGVETTVYSLDNDSVTADQSIAATTANTGTVAQLLSWIVKEIKSIKGTVTNWYDTAAVTLATLWGLTWTEKVILFNPADASVSPILPLSRNGTLQAICFYVQGTPSAATTITIKNNGTTIGTATISTTGLTVLTTFSNTTGNKRDQFTYTTTGTGLSSCTITPVQEWGNR